VLLLSGGVINPSATDPEALMDARAFFHYIVKPNYDEFVRSPNDIRLLWNALVSMNTVAEYLALERLGYPQVGRKVIYLEARKIFRLSGLAELKYCAETFKHVRKITDHSGGFTLQASSTGVSPGRRDGTMCFPVGVTREQVVRAVVQYIDGQPARMNENFVPLAIEALQSAWPCKH